MGIPEDSQEPLSPAGELPSNAELEGVSEEHSASDPLATVQAERDQWQDQCLRVRAEMDNMRKRLQRERDEERKYASLTAIRELLPVIDNLSRALEAGEKAGGDPALLEGVGMVARQLDEALSRLGATAIAAVGQPFDPNLHEALQQIPTAEYPPLTVIQELQRGYKLHDRVVRPSQVIVSAPPASEGAAGA